MPSRGKVATLRNRRHRGSAPVITNDGTASEFAIELFETGRYDQLGEIVHPPEAELDQRAAYPVTSWIRDVVGWLCEARTHDDVEASMHREALARIASRHEEQKQTLGAIFDLIDDPRSGPGNAAGGHAPERTPGGRSPSLDIYCLGQFDVWFAGRPVENWNGGRGKSILKFLASSGHRAEKEELMELLWPDAEPHSARNSLNVAVHGLRQTLSENRRHPRRSLPRRRVPLESSPRDVDRSRGLRGPSQGSQGPGGAR